MTKRAAKIVLTRIGSICSARMVYHLNGIFNYLHVGWWLRAHGFEPAWRVVSRERIFDLLGDELGDKNVLYLEFGVAQGQSMRYWSTLLRNPHSHLHGFDSFRGLPHDWTLEGHPRGYFSTSGATPQIDDPRIEFFAGWFEETLPRYRWPDHEALVVMMDADLYSSTTTALAFVKEKLRPGAYLYFDQFHHRCDELRAFAELLDEHQYRFTLVAASHDFSNVLFRRLP